MSPLTQPWRTALFLMVAGGFNYADRSALNSVMPALQAESRKGAARFAAGKGRGGDFGEI